MDRFAAMETFVCVVETGSFSAAARRLNIGQPAVSKTIAQLEKRLAVSLLLRSTRGLTPTEAGLAFFERARRAIDEANEADNAARGSAGGLRGNLRISAAVTFGRLHVVPQLGPFLDQHPQLNIDLMLDDRNINLVEEGIDVALRMGPLSDSSLTARKIADCRRVVLGTPAYFARHPGVLCSPRRTQPPCRSGSAPRHRLQPQRRRHLDVHQGQRTTDANPDRPPARQRRRGFARGRVGRSGADDCVAMDVRPGTGEWCGQGGDG